MSKTFDKVCSAITDGRVHVSDHAYDEAVDDGLSILHVLDRTRYGRVIEDYPSDPRGHSCLVLLAVDPDEAVHSVWAFDETA